MPTVQGAVNFQLFQRKALCGLFHHPSVFARLYRLEYYDDWCRMVWKVAQIEESYRGLRLNASICLKGLRKITIFLN